MSTSIRAARKIGGQHRREPRTGRIPYSPYNPEMATITATLIALMLGAWTAPQTPGKKPAADRVTVYRVQSCGCCGKWAKHLEAAGFDVTVNIIDDVAKAPGRDRVPQQLRSCHTAVVGRYVVEGHVPADVVRNLLRVRPAVEGIAVPGMPAGSPGMESPNPEPYDIIAFDKSGKTTTFARR